MTESPHLRYQVNLELSAMDPERFYVHSMSGREELSRLFAFDLVISPRDHVPLVFEDFEEIMGGTATITWGPEQEHPVHGAVREMELLPTDDPREVAYRVRVVPRLADTQLTIGSWIYQDLTVEEIITKALNEIPPEGAGLASGEDFELSLEGSYNPQEYSVQYEESIFNFVSRWAEHWGIAYHFEHGEEKEKVVFTDSNAGFPELEGFEEVHFDPRVDITDLTEHVFSIRATQRMVSHQVSLREYNYRTPSLSLVTEMRAIDEGGIGDVHISGEHYWTDGEGAALTEVRSQEMFGHKLRMVAMSRLRGIRAGHRFRLVGGTPEFLGLARDYLVLAVDHRFGRGGEGGDGSSVPSYENTLTLLPFEMAFRPDRITRKPRIYGFMHATVDAEAADDGASAPVDDWGRYKVVMPFDVAGETGGRSSCWIRSATPASGGGWGFGQQIHTGQEVAIFHVDGDPDRPVIAGAVPNFENPSVVTSHNANTSQFKSRNGSGFRIVDS